jgi:hypothetical protein
MGPSNQISLLNPLLVGVATILCTMIVHGMILNLIVAAARHDLRVGRAGVRFWTDLLLVSAGMLMAFELCGGLFSFGRQLHDAGRRLRGDIAPLEIARTIGSGRWHAHVRNFHRDDLCRGAAPDADKIRTLQPRSYQAVTASR